MPFILRPYRRFPIDLPVTYEAGFARGRAFADGCSQDGQGAVWNVSQHGWRMSGNLRLERGDVCSFKVILPTRKHVSVAAGIVRWVRGQDYGIETLVIDERSHARLRAYIQARVNTV